MSDLAQRLREVREDRDMTQAQVAAALGTNRQQVTRYETGERIPNADRLAALCRVLRVSSDYLLGLPPGLPRPR